MAIIASSILPSRRTGEPFTFALPPRTLLPHPFDSRVKVERSNEDGDTPLADVSRGHLNQLNSQWSGEVRVVVVVVAL